MSIASCRQSWMVWSHERMIGNLALADEVLGAGDLVGKHRGQQVLGAHALQLRRDLLAAAKARQRERRVAIQRQRAANIGASSIAWISTSRTLVECR